MANHLSLSSSFFSFLLFFKKRQVFDSKCSKKKDSLLVVAVNLNYDRICILQRNYYGFSSDVEKSFFF